MSNSTNSPIAAGPVTIILGSFNSAPGAFPSPSITAVDAGDGKALVQISDLKAMLEVVNTKQELLDEAEQLMRRQAERRMALEARVEQLERQLVQICGASRNN